MLKVKSIMMRKMNLKKRSHQKTVTMNRREKLMMMRTKLKTEYLRKATKKMMRGRIVLMEVNMMRMAARFGVLKVRIGTGTTKRIRKHTRKVCLTTHIPSNY